MRRGAVLLMVILTLAGCRPPLWCGTGREADMPEPDPLAVALEAEAEPTPEPEAPPKLGDALVYLPSPQNGLMQLRHEQPSLALIIDNQLDDPARAAFVAELFESDYRRTLDAAQAERLGLAKPEHAWMFGPGGPCEAKLGSAYAIADDEGLAVLELGYLVEPCTQEFAPVAFVGATPPDLTWHSVGCDGETQINDPKRWDHPERPAYESLGFVWTKTEDHPEEPEQVWVRSCFAGPVVVEFAWSWVWPEAQECYESELVRRELGLWRGGELELVPAFAREIPELVGALMNGDEPIAIIASGTPHLAIASYAAGQFSWAEKLVGEFHDEVVAETHESWSVVDCDYGEP